jgi:hypothetical protein
MVMENLICYRKEGGGEMNKEKIIRKVNEVARHPVFEKAVGGNKFGKTQFRTLCEMALKAECVAELELLIDYKTAKGNGWESYNNGSTLGQVIKNGLIELTQRTVEGPNEMTKTQVASLYFGYLHWKATEVKEQSKLNYNKRRG